MSKKHPGWVYLIHFSRPYRQARHYCGWALDPDARFIQHCNGTGARLTQIVIEAGIELVLAWKNPGTRKDERKLKNRKDAPKWCPICRAA